MALKIINFDVMEKANQKHHWLLPSSIRSIICGPSGCGKTNLMLNCLLQKGILNYDRLYIYSKTLGQDKYEFLRKYFDTLAKDVNQQIAYFYSNSDDILPPEKLDKKLSNVVVFDDVMLEKQNVIETFFSQGRHNNADCFYLCQSFFKIPKHGLRDNANMIIIFKQDNRNLTMIYNAYASGDMKFEEFKEFYSKCISEPYGFCVIDNTSQPYDGRYRSQFDTFYIPESYVLSKSQE